MDRNCLSYWWPILESAGIPVPRTKIVGATDGAVRALSATLCGEPSNDDDLRELRDFIVTLTAAAYSMGIPCFLRTGHTSGKHDWQNTCCVSDIARLKTHVHRLAEFSEMSDFVGLPICVWAVRKMLPTQPIAVLPKYGNMPLVPEIRCFIKSGKVMCAHPYWPPDSIKQGGCSDKSVIRLAQDIVKQNGWQPVANAVAKAFSNLTAFSVDLLPVQSDWYVTDMATAKSSWHWPDCKASE